MPCYDGRDSKVEYRTIYEDKPETLELIRELKELVKKYKAMLCALTTDLRNRGLLDEVVDSASKDGMIDIMEFIKTHKEEDIERLIAELKRFSDHEKELIKEILDSLKK